MQPIGTVITTEDSPSTSVFSFVFDPLEKSVKKGQYVQVENEQGVVFGYINEIFRSNRYFERAESVAEYERISSMKENFPTTSWEYIIAQVKVLGVSKEKSFQRASIPPIPGAKVYTAEENLLKSFLGLKDNGLFLGNIQHHRTEAKIDLTRLVQKHLAILAMSGAGKCVTYETPVIMGDGTRRTIGELADEAFAEGETRIEDGVEIAILKNRLQVLSMDAKFKLVKSDIYALTRRKSPESLVSLATRTGRKITLTAEHPVLVITQDGPKWEKAGQLSLKEHIAVPRELPFGNSTEIHLLDAYKDSESMRILDRSATLELKKALAISGIRTTRAIRYQLAQGCMPVRVFRELCGRAGRSDLFHAPRRLRHGSSQTAVPAKLVLDRKLGKFVGYLMGDGHTGRNNLDLLATVPEIREDFRALAKELFGLEASMYGKSVRVHSKTLSCVLCDVFGVAPSAGTKYASDTIMSANRDFVAGFLAGLFDTAGSVSAKKPEIEYCTKSPRLASRVSLLLLKFGICPVSKIKHNKKYGSNYFVLSVRGSSNLTLFQEKISIVSDKKRNRLEKKALLAPNANIDVVPSLGPLLSSLMAKLRISESETARRAGVSNNLSRYCTGDDSLSRNTFAKIAGVLSARAEELKSLCAAAESLSVPSKDISSMLEACSEAKRRHVMEHKQIAAHCGVSAATARRMLAGQTAVTDSILEIGRGVVEAAPPREAEDLDCMLRENEALARSDIAHLFNLADAMALSYDMLDTHSALWKGAWASFKRGERYPSLESRIRMVWGLKTAADGIMHDLNSCADALNTVVNVAESSLLWDEVVAIKRVASSEKYVYDLALKGDHNFVAGDAPLLIHNSHLATVLIEELLDRKKEDGRIAVIVIDIHGEYMGFADGPYANRTKMIEVGNRKYGFSIPLRKINPEMFEEWLPILSYPQKALLRNALLDMRSDYKKNRKAYGVKDLLAAIDAYQGDGKKANESAVALKRSLAEILRMKILSQNRENPKLTEAVKPGNLLIFDFSDVVNLRKKQVIVSLLARKLFHLRKRGQIPPFLLIVEEAHNFAREKAEAYEAVSRSVIETIAREGRKFGAALCLITQRPVNLSTTALSQCNTHIILRITNPNDLDHIQQSSEGIDARIAKSITSLRVGEGIIVGEATNAPIFVDIRNIKVKKREKGRPLAELAVEYEKMQEKREEDAEAFL